ncbi:unnamed protein product, partial [Porites evermanni]
QVEQLLEDISAPFMKVRSVSLNFTLGKNVIAGNSFFLVLLRKKEIREEQCCYNPELEFCIRPS